MKIIVKKLIWEKIIEDNLGFKINKFLGKTTNKAQLFNKITKIYGKISKSKSLKSLNNNNFIIIFISLIIIIIPDLFKICN